MPGLGGPLPFPGDAGRQLSCLILPSAPSQGDGWITRVLRGRDSASAESPRVQASVGPKNGRDGIDRWVGALKAPTGPLLG
jgi:hypothetical protein